MVPGHLQDACQKDQAMTTSQFFASGGQSIRVSASASVLPMDIQA